MAHAASAPVSAKLPRRGYSERRAFLENVILAGVLPGIAGAVNAAGFLSVGLFTSHVTGLVGRFGDESAQDHGGAAVQAATLIGVFLLGAITATILIDVTRMRARARYVAPLLLEAALLGGFVFLETRIGAPPNATLLAGLLCASMGLQNALVTRISGAVVRTTHLTGIVTDLGIESVRLAGWMRRRLMSSRNLRRPMKVFRLMAAGREWKKLRLHVMIFTSFVSGAVVGPRLLLRFGQGAMLLPCALLLLLAAGDFFWGIRARHVTDA